MPPYARAVLGTDFSDAAALAARVAPRLVPTPRDMRVVHAVPPLLQPGLAAGEPFVGAALPPAAYAPQVALDTEGLERRLAEWCADAGLAESPRRVVVGEAAAALANAAREADAGVLVLGARGHSRLERFLGTTAMAVAHDAPCDVLLARSEAPFRRVLVATDFYAPSARAAQRAKALVAPGGEVVLAHAQEGGFTGAALAPEDPAAALRGFNAEHFGGAAHEALMEGPPAKRLRELAGDRRADLLVVGSHGAGPLERLILGSVARTLVETAPCSVLLVKPADAG